MLFLKWQLKRDTRVEFMQSTRRVVISGIGVVSPLGCGIENAWNRLITGQHGIRSIDGIPKQCSVSIAAQVPVGSNQEQYNDKYPTEIGLSKEISKFIAYALYSSDLALKNAALYGFEDRHDSCRAGVAIGSGGIADIKEIVDANDSLRLSYKKVSPYFVPKILSNMAAGQVSIRHRLRGPVHSVVTACAAGSHSIGDAFNFIRLGYADLMLAGGSDAVIDNLSIAGFARMRALCTDSDPAISSRPFDMSRSGFIIGEGAAVLVLEELGCALKRDAPIVAEVCGYGLTGDAFHATSPSQDGDGAQRCMRMALKDAGVSVDEIGYVNAHATSTPVGDAIEAGAIAKVFQQRSGASTLYVSSTKGATGHLLGAAGSLELAFTAKALQTGIIPPTLNLNSIDPSCAFPEVFQHVPNKAISSPSLRYAVKNSFGFGGTNACLVLKKWTR